MARPLLRSLSPRGLYARSVLITLVPVLVVLALMTLYYFNGHLRAVNTKLSQGVARQILLIKENCEISPTNLSVHASIEQNLSLKYDCDFQSDTEDETERDKAVPAKFFYAGLVKKQFEEMLELQTDILMRDGKRKLDIRVPVQGRILQIVLDRKRAVDINGHIFIVWVALLGLLMTATALAFLRNHVRSVLRLTEAAQAFGRGQALAGFRPSGAREVRAAAQAVIEMRERLTAFAEQRTMMLAGVSHDLRTPLTRLQLQLAMQEQTEDVLEARADIRDMEMMLEEYLAFARGEEGEQAEEVVLSDMVAELVAKFPKVTLVKDEAEGISLMARPIAIKRAISNLLQNAAAYGDRVEVSLEATKSMLVLSVDDNGPGIPEEKYEDAFRPFARLNEARTQNVSGVGLGLGLARDTARIHGGSVNLGQSLLGGLRVQMHFPV